MRGMRGQGRECPALRRGRRGDSLQGRVALLGEEDSASLSSSFLGLMGMTGKRVKIWAPPAGNPSGMLFARTG